MEFPYFSSAPQPGYPYYGVGQPQPAQTDQPGQFRSVAPPPTTEQFEPTFPSFDTYQFDHSTHQPNNTAKINGAQKLDSDSFPLSIAAENGEDGFLEHGQLRSSSEEKDNLAPAQSRRKAQNRAAQRAFRERKERRVRDLEQKLNECQQSFSTLLEDNESLKRQVAKFATENEILRATSNAGQCPASTAVRCPEPTTTGPLRYNPKDYTAENGDTKKPGHRLKVNEVTGEKLLDPSATWDLIVSHLSDKGLKFDVQDIYDRLKGRAQCDGQGPVIEESHVLKAIQESITAGNDELI